MADIRKNEVKSATKKRGQLTLEFFDNEGKIKQKDTGLPPTKANRKHLWTKIVPMFEEQLKQKQFDKEARNFGYYSAIYLELNSSHSKISMMKGYVKSSTATLEKKPIQRILNSPR